MSSQSAEPSPTPPGRRAANKADKLRRISLAARELFAREGFDSTTMRDIATRSGVGFGTLFDYATNKRDLLFLIFNPELDLVLDDSIAAAAREMQLLDKLMALFSGHYVLYSREKAISRAVLRELTFFSEGSEAAKFIAHRNRFLAAVERLLGESMDSEQRQRTNPQLLARILFAVFAWDVRHWLSQDAVSVARGLADLRQLLELQLRGLEAQSASAGKTTKRAITRPTVAP